MDKRKEREIVAACADRSLRGGATSSSRISQDERVQVLLDLAEALQAILMPVKPDPRFRRRLHGELILAAQEREPEPAPSLFQQHRRGILIGAALGSVASVVGVALAFVLRQRHSRATHAATG